MHVDSETDQLAPSKHVKSQKNTIRKAFCWRAHSGPRFGAGCCKLALYDTCSSDIHVVKETRACACHLPKVNSKIRLYMYSCAD